MRRMPRFRLVPGLWQAAGEGCGFEEAPSGAPRLEPAVVETPTVQGVDRVVEVRPG